MNDTVLRVQGLRKNYPAFTLSEVSFSLEARPHYGLYRPQWRR